MLKCDESIIRRLENAKDKGRLSHAYVFSGDNMDVLYGTSLRIAAMLYTNDVNDITYKQIMDNCHLNVLVIEPLEGKQSIAKEQILDLINTFSYTSMIDGPRIYIIKDFDSATPSAQNSLLKFIEEPGKDIYGILLTSNLEGVLTTIKSRSVIINFKDATKEDIINSLDYDLDDNYILGTLIKNNIKYDIDSDEYREFKELLYKFLEVNNKVDAVLLKEKIDINRENLHNLLTILIAIYEDALDASKLKSSYIYDKINKISQLNYELIVKRLTLLLNTYDRINLNMNISGLFNNLLIYFF